jgi:cellulose/xylan binding protein with CBM9 domain
LTVGFLLIAAFAMTLTTQTGNPPTYRAPRAVDAIHVDGRLAERSWAQAPRIRAFTDIFQPTRPVKYATEAAIVWDDANLYVAFACADDAPWGTLTTRDDRLWDEEVVEVFLDPDGDGLNYAELEVSPNNVVVDLLIDRPRGDTAAALTWDIAGLQTAVGRRSGGWDVEIAIPWKSLAATGIDRAPARGDRWRAGIYRIKRPGGPLRADRAADEYLAWSLTRADRGFHDPERFGYLLFD